MMSKLNDKESDILLDIHILPVGPEKTKVQMTTFIWFLPTKMPCWLQNQVQILTQFWWPSQVLHIYSFESFQQFTNNVEILLLWTNQSKTVTKFCTLASLHDTKLKISPSTVSPYHNFILYEINDYNIFNT